MHFSTFRIFLLPFLVIYYFVYLLSSTTLHPPPSTLHPPPSTLHPPPSTLHPPPSTLHPPHSILHPPSSIIKAIEAATSHRLSPNLNHNFSSLLSPPPFVYIRFQLPLFSEMDDDPLSSLCLELRHTSDISVTDAWGKSRSVSQILIFVISLYSADFLQRIADACVAPVVPEVLSPNPTCSSNQRQVAHFSQLQSPIICCACRACR
jgi:hypothetical protein